MGLFPQIVTGDQVVALVIGQGATHYNQYYYITKPLELLLEQAGTPEKRTALGITEQADIDKITDMIAGLQALQAAFATVLPAQQITLFEMCKQCNGLSF